MTTPPEVWTFSRARPTPEVGRAVAAIRRVCSDRGWQFQPKSYLSFRQATGFVHVITQGDADNLYRRAHRARVCVLSVQSREEPGPFVCCRPSQQDALATRSIVSLRIYSIHKTFFRRLRANADVTRWAGAFAHWCTTQNSEGEHDPRTLPLHVFASRPGHHPRLLYSAEERRRFDVAHRHGPDRLDFETRLWPARGPYDGYESLSVAGRTLDRGFHWDVCPSRPGEITLYTPTEEWRIAEYLNVYPDGGTRVTQKGHARKKESPRQRGQRGF